MIVMIELCVVVLRESVSHMDAKTTAVLGIFNVFQQLLCYRLVS